MRFARTNFAQWHLTDDAEHARIVGGEFYEERQRLTEEADRVRKLAQDELLHRLRNITGPNGAP